MTYEFDPRLEHASTIPSRYYIDAAVLARRESERLRPHVAARRARAEQVREPGQLLHRDDRQRAGAGRARQRRRAARDVERLPPSRRSGRERGGEASRPAVRLSRLDVRARRAPADDAGVRGVQCFDRAIVSLPQFRVEIWNELVFVNLDPNAPPLARVPRRSRRDCAPRDYRGFRLAARKDWELDCNWKVYVDNYLEGYHIPIVHPVALPRARLPELLHRDEAAATRSSTRR